MEKELSDLSIDAVNHLVGAMDRVSQNMASVAGRLSKTIEDQTEKNVASNAAMAKSNGQLTVALILTTLVVGLLQAFVIWKTSSLNSNAKSNIATIETLVSSSSER